MPDVFISLRFAEAHDEGRLLQEALIRRGMDTFLCAVAEGDNIATAVSVNLVKAKLVVILGTATYGKETSSSCSTKEELVYTMEAKKPFFLVKMCETFEVELALFYLNPTVVYYPWKDSNRRTVPEDLIQRIHEKFKALGDTASTEVSETKGKEVSASLVDEKFVPTVPELKKAQEALDWGEIVLVLTKHASSNARIATEALKLIAKDPYFENLDSLGAIDAVLLALRTFGMNDSNLAAAGCDAVQNLASHDANCSKLGDKGACELVFSLLESFCASDKWVVSNSCAAIGKLTIDDDKNVQRMLKLEPFRCLCKAFGAFGTKDAEIAENCCHAIGALADNEEARDKFAKLGACELVHRALEQFGTKSKDLTSVACSAIASLTCDQDEISLRFGELGTCERLLAALKTFGYSDDEDFAFDICEAIGNLAMDDENAKKLGRAGACPIVVEVLKLYGADDEKLAEAACDAIINLCEENVSNRELFRKAGVKDASKAARKNERKAKALKLIS